MPIEIRYEQQLFEYLDSLRSSLRGQPLYLGATSSGTGGPPGGFIGYLPQRRVAYDPLEAATLVTPTVSASIIDNLNHIRFNIATISGEMLRGIIIQDNGVQVASGIDTFNFVNATITVSGTKVTVTTSGGGGGSDGHTIQDEGIDLTARTNLNFEGNFVVAADDAGNDASLVTISGTHGHTVQDEGVSLSQRNYLNFIGNDVTVTDDSVNNKTLVTVSGTGHTIQDEGIGLTARTNLNFVGSSVTVVDDGGTNASIVTLSGHRHIYNEDLTSQVTVSGVTGFTTAFNFLQDTVLLYYNGLRQRPLNFTTYSGQYITTAFTVTTPDEILVDYVYDSNIPTGNDLLLLEDGDELLLEDGGAIELE